MSAKPVCDLEHPRAKPAAVKIQIRSTRVGRPGHPMTRELLLCSSHAAELRRLGVQLVDP